jgi:membrane-bound ClpP family serine protease
MGRETVAGRRGKVTRDLNPNGLVTVDGEEWSAISEEEERIPQGAPVQVLRIEGLVLHVRALHDAAEDNMK